MDGERAHPLLKEGYDLVGEQEMAPAEDSTLDCRLLAASVLQAGEPKSTTGQVTICAATIISHGSDATPGFVLVHRDDELVFPTLPASGPRLLRRAEALITELVSKNGPAATYMGWRAKRDITELWFQVSMASHAPTPVGADGSVVIALASDLMNARHVYGIPVSDSITESFEEDPQLLMAGSTTHGAAVGVRLPCGSAKCTRPGQCTGT